MLRFRAVAHLFFWLLLPYKQKGFTTFTLSKVVWAWPIVGLK
jgi:hypothetical protein